MNEEENKRLGTLLLELAKGKVEVLEEIARFIEKILYFIGNRYYDNKADIEDSIQNLYLLLYKKAKKFRKGNACAWILTVYRNSVLNYLKGRKKEMSLEDENVERVGIKDERYIDNHLFLRELFDKLNKEESELLEYRHACGCTVRELAEIFHTSKSSIERKLKALEAKINNLKE